MEGKDRATGCFLFMHSGKWAVGPGFFPSRRADGRSAEENHRMGVGGRFNVTFRLFLELEHFGVWDFSE